MALLDFLKNKKEADKAKEKKIARSSAKPTAKPARSAPEAKEAVVVKEPVSKALPVKKKQILTEGFSYQAIQEPHISEKSTYLAGKNQYVFRVHPQANKPEIKKAVEGIYHVTVLSVNIVTIPKKKRRLGRTEGFKKGFSKAIVTISEGQKIEII